MLCTVCGVNEVKADERDFCIVCQCNGKRFEMFLLSEERGNVLGRLREIPHVTSATIWHQGNGLFQLGVMLDDGRLVAPGIAIEVPDEGLAVQSAIPPEDMPWGVAITDAVQENVSVLARPYTDDELVAVVGRIAENNLDDEDAPTLDI